MSHFDEFVSGDSYGRDYDERYDYFTPDEQNAIYKVCGNSFGSTKRKSPQATIQQLWKHGVSKQAIKTFIEVAYTQNDYCDPEELLDLDYE